MTNLPAEWRDDHPVVDMSATQDEVADLVATIFHAPWEDASRMNMVAAEACKVLGELAVQGNREATQCLRRIHRAVDLGAPIDEPHWDTAGIFTSEPRYMDTLDESERTPD